MTEVNFHEEDDLITLTIQGHAEYAQTSEDIVCAACSVLSGTLATMINNLPVAASVRFESGFTRITINRKGLSIYAIQIKDAFDFVMLGYRLLEQRYPDNVIITEG